MRPDDGEGPLGGESVAALRAENGAGAAAGAPLPPIVPHEASCEAVDGPSPAAAAIAAKRHRAGKFAGQGYPREWIAERFGVTLGTVANWERTIEFGEGYATEEARMSRAADMALTKIALSLNTLVDTSLAVALDTSHKDSSVERRYLIDKVLTPMSIQHTTNTLQADVRFWEPVAAALTRVATLAPVAVPQLVDGKEAAEEYGAAPEGANGSAPTVAAPTGHAD